MNRRIVSSLVLLVCLVLAGPVLAPSTAYADGGTRPSNAPTLTPDHQVSGGAATVDTYAICCHQWQHPNSPGVQYWKVPLDFGDSLTLDYENVTGTYTGVCILAPSTTDFTVGTSDCVADDSTGDSKYSELKFTAPTSGAWFVVIHDNYCCSDEAWAYTLTAKVAHRTSVSLQGPAKSHRGRKITLSGAITPGISTGVAIQRKIGTGKWATIANLTTTSTGAFSKRTKLRKVATYKFRARFAGAWTYLGSKSPVVKVNVRP
jgi:hypothetical protein